ncbi:MAG: hypothetical protein COV72_02960 [Candidatus Omnitrophica bacterium CG11_big_fil_rev_8_21_14_0_20_42_13]|uniref:Polysaccharide pyruvyl transferase domain-containing protein n=1 Tax=Candidatus Ghiorseimicrobium undicola TaxID=1974746 RepID=A0A2H0LYI2_9BACT|nr:MAG: hypothetical protein COV72_02960 [Candidatus Omnitrophica bacterium CG11_big_fil_rev_8_21_14_0_20_42_13]
MHTLISKIGSLKRNWQYCLPFQKRLGYVGWNGHNNLGDEAILEASKNLFPDFKLVNFKYTAKIEKLEKYFGKLYDSVIFGGGTVINEPGYLEKIKLALDNGYKVFILGAGVRNPAFWDRHDERNNCLDEFIPNLKKCAFVGIRGPVSMKILKENGFHNASITGDTALLFAQKEIKRKKQRKKIGINFGASAGKVWGREEDILQFIIKISGLIARNGWEITFVPVWDNDIGFIEKAAKQLNGKVKIFYDYKSLSKTLDLLNTFDVFIGQKLHSVVLALCAYTPSIMLEYRPKCHDFMCSMELENFNMRTDALSSNKLLNMVDELYINSSHYQKSIFKKVNEYKNALESAAQIIRKKIC